MHDDHGNHDTHENQTPTNTEVELVTCPECGNVASIEWSSYVGEVLLLKLRCVERHWFLMPAETITYYGTDLPYLPSITQLLDAC